MKDKGKERKEKNLTRSKDEFTIGESNAIEVTRDGRQWWLQVHVCLVVII